MKISKEEKEYKKVCEEWAIETAYKNLCREWANDENLQNAMKELFERDKS